MTPEYPPPPLSDVQRDALIRTMLQQIRSRDETIAELRAELILAHEETAALKRGLVPEQPFG